MSFFEKENTANIRQPAVANTFYPGNAGELSRQVHAFLDEAASTDKKQTPKAIIAPHAGYIYSGPVAASAYARLAGAQDTITRVVLLGPSHRVPFYGCAVSSADAFSTPLGEIPLDKQSIKALIDNGLAKTLDQAHTMEHSLEVHLPFLQMVLNSFLLVPVVVGEASADEVSKLLGAVWGGDETLIVISSDLSHYHTYETAREIDLDTCRKIEMLDYQTLTGSQACGYMPVRGLLYLAQQQHLKVETIDYRNSGDTAGPRDQVVGYGAYVIYQ